MVSNGVKNRVNPWLLLIILVLSSCSIALPPLPRNEAFREGETCFLTGRFQAALTAYQQFLTRRAYSPHRLYTLCQIGLCALALGQNDQAIDYFQQALKGARELHLKSRVLVGLGNAYSSKDDYSPAARYYLRALKETRAELSDKATVLFKLATALMRSGHWSAGRKYLEELVQLKSAPDYLTEAAKTRLALPEDTFVVQLGKFQEKDNAFTCLNAFKNDKGIDAELKVFLIDGNFYYFIWAGTYPDWQPARQLVQELQARGIEAIMIP